MTDDTAGAHLQQTLADWLTLRIRNFHLSQTSLRIIREIIPQLHHQDVPLLVWGPLFMQPILSPDENNIINKSSVIVSLTD